MKSYVEIILSVKLARCNYASMPDELLKYLVCYNLFNKPKVPCVALFATSSEVFCVPAEQMQKIVDWARYGLKY